jgi:hypothetical protein
VRLVGYRPAREAFALGRMMVIPSRAESLPYVILARLIASISAPISSGGMSRSLCGPKISGMPPTRVEMMGAKGAALARLTMSAPHAIRVYTGLVRLLGDRARGGRKLVRRGALILAARHRRHDQSRLDQADQSGEHDRRIGGRRLSPAATRRGR